MALAFQALKHIFTRLHTHTIPLYRLHAMRSRKILSCQWFHVGGFTSFRSTEQFTETGNRIAIKFWFSFFFFIFFSRFGVGRYRRKQQPPAIEWITFVRYVLQKGKVQRVTHIHALFQTDANVPPSNMRENKCFEWKPKCRMKSHSVHNSFGLMQCMECVHCAMCGYTILYIYIEKNPVRHFMDENKFASVLLQ